MAGKRKLTDAFNIATRILDHEVLAVAPNDPHAMRLLEDAYKDIYEPAFPLEEERESLETLIDNMSGKNPVSQAVVLLAGENLNTDTPTTKGISIGYYYFDAAVGLMAYNAIRPEYRNAGLGKVMVIARNRALAELADKRQERLRGVFLECNDPDKIKAEDDSLDPATRISIFTKWGARVIPFDYVQPPLEPSGEKCRTLKLLNYPHPETGVYPETDDVKAFVTSIYMDSAAYLNTPVRQDPDYIRMMDQLDALKINPRPAPSSPPPSAPPSGPGSNK